MALSKWNIARRVAFAVALSVAGGLVASAEAQIVRNYNVQFTATAPTADGVVSPGEWDTAAAAAGTWGVLRETEADLDTENNRFRMMWDATNLYVLYETNFNNYSTPIDKIGIPNPGISFGDDNLNMYFDPNTDGGPNFVRNPDDDVDGYQFAWNQYRDPDGGALISTNANRQGVGFFTEAHAGTPFGDNANWNRGGGQADGAALQDIVLAQKNGTGGGVAELVIPWANINADATIPGSTTDRDVNSDLIVDGGDYLKWQQGFGLTGEADKSNGDINRDGSVAGDDLALWRGYYGRDYRVTGLNRVTGPINGEQWFFNMSRINHDAGGGNFLPIWNWHPAQSFALRPHGTITFQGRPGAEGVVSAVPEPATVVLAGLAAMLIAARRRCD